jgi:hypothetical protein
MNRNLSLYYYFADLETRMITQGCSGAWARSQKMHYYTALKEVR